MAGSGPSSRRRRPHPLNRTAGAYADSGISTDGLLAVAADDGATLMAEGETCVVNGMRIVASDEPVTVLRTGNDLSCSARRPATPVIAAGKTIRSVSVNGKRVPGASFDRDAGTATVRAPAGDSEIALR